MALITKISFSIFSCYYVIIIYCNSSCDKLRWDLHGTTSTVKSLQDLHREYGKTSGSLCKVVVVAKCISSWYSKISAYVAYIVQVCNFNRGHEVFVTDSPCRYSFHVKCVHSNNLLEKVWVLKHYFSWPMAEIWFPWHEMHGKFEFSCCCVKRSQMIIVERGIYQLHFELSNFFV